MITTEQHSKQPLHKAKLWEHYPPFPLLSETKWEDILSRKATCVPAELYNKLIFSGASLVNVFQYC